MPLLLACGSSDDGAASSAAGAGGAGGGLEGGAGQGGSTGGAPGSDPLVLSVIAESGPGNEPAMVRFFNDSTDLLLSLAIGDGQAYAFVEVPTGMTTPFLPKALIDLQDWVEVGVCDADICVAWPVDEFVGPGDLMPGLAYTMRVEDTAPNEFRLEVIEEPPPAPFVGARVKIEAPGNGPPDKAVRLDVSLDDADDLVFEDSYESYAPSQYVQVADGQLAISGIEFRDRSNRIFASDEAQTLDASLGYTLVVSTQPADGAVYTATLEPQP